MKSPGSMTNIVAMKSITAALNLRYPEKYSACADFLSASARLILKIVRMSNGNHRRIRCNHRYQDWHIPPLVYRPRWRQAVGRYRRAHGAGM